MKPGVYFICQHCKWRHDVPDEHVRILHGIPRATYVPLHACDAPDVEERSCYEAELVTTMPAQNWTIKL